MKYLTYVFVALSAYVTGVQADTLTIIPAQPRYMEPVYLNIQPTSASVFPLGAQVSMSGNVLDVRWQGIIELPTGRRLDVMLGRLPEGRYTVRTTGMGQTAEIAFTVGPAPVAPPTAQGAPTVNYTDLWWNPAESGWGINIVQGPTNKIFASWFVYDEARRPVWYTLEPGEWSAGGPSYTGPIYRHTGPPLGTPFNSSTVTEERAGTGTLNFTSFETATFTYSIAGVPTTQKNIRRMPIE